ncbi:16669_t:CDS:2 [Rhizophagus irregularis]|nr:16669_t:CDS:2 [Rhizophagus irregularis]
MKTSSITTELGTPLSFSFANFIPNSNNLKNQKVTKPTFSHLNLENDIDKVLQSMKQQCEIEYAKLNERIALLKAEEQILDEEIEEQKKNQKILTTKPHLFYREKNLLSESEIIHNVLLNKLEKLQLDESDDESESQSEIGAIRQELRSIKSNYNMLMDELNDFIDTNFPPPNFEKDEVDERIWPPYVETLIRSGIAKRNPNDANMLKLVEFHL